MCFWTDRSFNLLFNFIVFPALHKFWWNPLGFLCRSAYQCCIFFYLSFWPHQSRGIFLSSFLTIKTHGRRWWTTLDKIQNEPWVCDVSAKWLLYEPRRECTGEYAQAGLFVCVVGRVCLVPSPYEWFSCGWSVSPFVHTILPAPKQPGRLSLNSGRVVFVLLTLWSATGAPRRPRTFSTLCSLEGKEVTTAAPK